MLNNGRITIFLVFHVRNSFCFKKTLCLADELLEQSVEFFIQNSQQYSGTTVDQLLGLSEFTLSGVF